MLADDLVRVGLTNTENLQTESITVVWKLKSSKRVLL